MTVPVRKAAEDRRRDVELAALDLAYLHGPASVSTGMIATRLGLTQPAIYKHFKSKDDIWLAAATRLAAKIRANVSRVEQAGLPPVAALRQLVLGHLDLVARNPALPELMTMRGNRTRHGAFQVTIQRALADLRGGLEHNIGKAEAARAFRTGLDTADAASLILGVIQSLVLRMLVTRDTSLLQKDGGRLLELLLAGFTSIGEET